jgi:hypothetical protein
MNADLNNKTVDYAEGRPCGYSLSRNRDVDFEGVTRSMTRVRVSQPAPSRAQRVPTREDLMRGTRILEHMERKDKI